MPSLNPAPAPTPPPLCRVEKREIKIPLSYLHHPGLMRRLLLEFVQKIFMCTHAVGLWVRESSICLSQLFKLHNIVVYLKAHGAPQLKD